ncbi:hypothetical protein Tco_1514804 [Tanacetum coccineum]
MGFIIAIELLKKHGLDECVSSRVIYGKMRDADHAGCKDDCKSTSGGLQFLGGKLVSWSSKKQDCTAMSTAEAEYVSLSACCAQLRRVLWKFTLSMTKTILRIITKALPKRHAFEYLVHCIVIIMAQQQHAADVHPDELCPPKKRYDLMDANKKVDLECAMPTGKQNSDEYHQESSITIQHCSFFIRTMDLYGTKELTLILDDFRTIFHLLQATENNHNSFVPPLLFSDMVPFYKQVFGFTMELKTSSSFKTTGLLQPWQMLCKIFSKCLTTRVIGWDQPPLQIMQMMYCFVNNIHVDYAELL